jgi:hypothetical protein
MAQCSEMENRWGQRTDRDREQTETETETQAAEKKIPVVTRWRRLVSPPEWGNAQGTQRGSRLLLDTSRCGHGQAKMILYLHRCVSIYKVT